MWLYRFTRRFITPIFRIYVRGERICEAGDVPATGPLIVVVNHSSFLDGWFIGMLFPREVHYLMNDRWFRKSRIWNAFFRWNGVVPVRSEDPRATLEAACAVLEKGEVLAIFPEGKITSDGRLQGFRSGFARMAARSGAPVVPVGMRGAYDCLPRHRRFPRPVTIHMHIGAPRVFPGSPTDAPPSVDELRRFVELLFDDVRSLSALEVAPRLGRGEPAEP